MFQPRLILCPTDLSQNSIFAFRIARDLARQYNAGLLVLHVADTLGPEALSFGEASTRLQPEAHIAELTQSLKQIAPDEPGLEIQRLLGEGDPVTVIQRVVRDHHCDLVVLGTHGRSGLDHLFISSIAEKIIRTCPCPSLVARYPNP
jgi:nucleotide-binding universal stress UspA family protein